MKVRQGFVSNSSTTSFCIYGGEIGSIDVCKLRDVLIANKDEFLPSFKSVKADLEAKMAKKSREDYEAKALKLFIEIMEGGSFDDVTINGCEHEFDRETCKHCPECGSKNFVTEQSPLKVALEEYADDDYEFWGYLGLDYHSDGYNSYIGKSWTCIDDDQTGREFKDSIEKILKPLGCKCHTIEEAYYN